ncbi:glycosyl hydrolase family 65 protein [Nissabacter archeti]|uniref:glycosyl hydrolase family 65 protein n=1 Tax=Nissabacter archeti TaxID=1917880 RepID=UPI000A574BD3|nr:glycosyl hydrolase family 65 protein [Nissabacter archeti]
MMTSPSAPFSVLCEPGFSPHQLNKYATLMTCGNGYLGIRGGHEEAYTDQVRGMFVAGFYHRATPDEVTELVNLPDITGCKIELGNTPFSLLAGTLLSYRREFHPELGELCRELIWQSPEGGLFSLKSARFVARAPQQLVAATLTLTALDQATPLRLSTGIDATQTNSGRQHLTEASVRVMHQHTLQGCYRTPEGDMALMLTSHCRLSTDDVRISYAAKNRRLTQQFSTTLQVGVPLTLEKFSWVDVCLPGDAEPASWDEHCLAQLAPHVEQGYAALRAASLQQWQHWWPQARVEVDSSDAFDQLALDMSAYHLAAMTPAHDERCSVAAKGLTGEGYKGHVFWDTDIFILPYHLLTRPETARALLRYRYHRIPQAQQKAARCGYEGALFPWESAFTGEEETPAFGLINIRTGLRQPVASALAEHHLVADIAYATVGYLQATGDAAFQATEAQALLKACALFWLSRTTEVNGRLELHDVIGPDEYTEHVNNNAYTNYLAHYSVAQALHYLPDTPEHAGFRARGRDFLARCVLPQPDNDRVIPQDDSFFSKPTIDLTRYQAKAGTQSILLDYSRAEVNEMQILKQADLIMLFFLLPSLFSQDVQRANLDYYLPRTIHDSSLSKAIYAIVACRNDMADLAWPLYREAMAIDLGPEPHSCDDGIHAAATGAIWLGAIMGFAGLEYQEGQLVLSPRLPPHWKTLRFPLRWRGEQLQVSISQQHLQIEKATDAPLSISVHGTLHSFTRRLVLALH